METWKKILLICVFALAGIYLAGVLWWMQHKPSDTPCKALKIVYTDRQPEHFASTDELRKFIADAQLNPEGSIITDKRCHQIEALALQHPMIRTATCFATPAGNVVLELTQREPRLRVMGADNYYVDADRRIMPVRSSTAADVPIITGQVTREMATHELFDFAMWIEDDEFWQAQIEQINVVSPSRIELIPRIGSSTIILGTLANYEQKLSRLLTLYRKGFSRFGWTEYREIDLRFSDQIVCR